jgi:Uma2 family endonuclease
MFTWDRIPLEESGDVANVFRTYPDWTIEILSPVPTQQKSSVNILHCLNQGSRLGWLIDPDQRSLFVYPSGQQPEWYTESAEKLPVPNLVAEFQLTLGNLWGWLKL